MVSVVVLTTSCREH